MLLDVDRIAISTARAPLTSELGLSDTPFGWALSAFALGYALFQTPAARSRVAEGLDMTTGDECR
jgi:ACS family glucarate transporter-like MFS transporter